MKLGPAIRPEDIPVLASTYHLDSERVAAEFADFREAFRTLSRCSEAEIEPMPDAVPDSDDDTADLEMNEDDVTSAQQFRSRGQKAFNSFLEPLSILYQLSGYEHLLRVYWTLVTLPVTSCSAERALSRLKIIKNRLRSTMSDEWMSDLMVLAAEKDIAFSIANDKVIDSYACLSDQLKRQLLFI